MQIRIKREEEKNISEFTLPTIAISKQCLGQGFFSLQLQLLFTLFNEKLAFLSIVLLYSICYHDFCANLSLTLSFKQDEFELFFIRSFCITIFSMILRYCAIASPIWLYTLSTRWRKNRVSAHLCLQITSNTLESLEKVYSVHQE